MVGERRINTIRAQGKFGYAKKCLLAIALTIFFANSAQSASGSYFVSASASSDNLSGNIYLYAGEVFTATTSGRTGDPYLYLWNSSNVVVAQDDDGNGDLNSRIVYSVPTSGNYRINNRCHSSTSTCSYTVTYSTSTVIAPTNSSIPTISGTTTFGQTLSAGVGSWNNSPTSYAYQ